MDYHIENEGRTMAYKIWIINISFMLQHVVSSPFLLFVYVVSMCGSKSHPHGQYFEGARHPHCLSHIFEREKSNISKLTNYIKKIFLPTKPF